MIRIGVIGENDNDAKAISELLKKNFSENFHFHRLLPNINGSQLDDKKSNHLVIKLRKEFELEDLHYVLYIRDLDALAEDKEQVKFRKNRFRRFSKTVNNQAIFMLNIYEIEALILADFENYKRCIGKEDLIFDGKIAHTLEKKELDDFLNLCNYSKTDLATILPQLDFNTIFQNHPFFNFFIKEFRKMIALKKYKKDAYS
jgi:hypothetical protein